LFVYLIDTLQNSNGCLALRIDW